MKVFIACLLAALYFAQFTKCEELDLEKILKQITPDPAESFESVPSGEFARFRRSHILSADEEKGLINEEDNTDSNKKFSVVKLPDSANNVVDSPMNIAQKLKLLETPAAKFINPAVAKLSNVTVNNDKPSAIKMSNVTVGNEKPYLMKLSNVTTKVNTLKVANNTNSTGRSHIVMFDYKPAQPRKQIQEDQMNLKNNGPNKAQEVSPDSNATEVNTDSNATETNTDSNATPDRRYIVPIDESGSGSGITEVIESGSGEESGAESGSGGESGEIENAIKRSIISKTGLFRADLNDGLTLNEAAFLSNLENGESGSGVGSGESSIVKSDIATSGSKELVGNSGSGESEITTETASRRNLNQTSSKQEESADTIDTETTTDSENKSVLKSEKPYATINDSVGTIANESVAKHDNKSADGFSIEPSTSTMEGTNFMQQQQTDGNALESVSNIQANTVNDTVGGNLKDDTTPIVENQDPQNNEENKDEINGTAVIKINDTAHVEKHNVSPMKVEFNAPMLSNNESMASLDKPTNVTSKATGTQATGTQDLPKKSKSSENI